MVMVHLSCGCSRTPLFLNIEEEEPAAGFPGKLCLRASLVKARSDGRRASSVSTCLSVSHQRPAAQDVQHLRLVQEPLNPFLRKVWPMWERSEVQRLAGETHGEQIDTSRPSDSSMSRIMGRVHQIKNNPSDQDSSQHLLLLWLSLMNCDAWLDIYFLLFFLRFYQKPNFFSHHDI